MRIERPWLTIELSSACELACPHCAQKNPSIPGKGHLPLDAFARILDDLVATRARYANVNLFYRGESLQHPEFARAADLLLAAQARHRIFEYPVLHTNAHRLNPENRAALLRLHDQSAFASCGNLVISLDAATPDTYRRVRPGAPLENAVENARAFVRERAARKQFGPNLIFQFIVQDRNAAEAPAFLETWSAFLAAESHKPFRAAMTLGNELERIDGDTVYFRRLRPVAPTHEIEFPALEARARDLYLTVRDRLGLALEEERAA